MELTLEPDLHPLYPTPADVSRLLSPNSGLTPSQKSTLVSHCLTRAAAFADLSFVQYIIHDVQAQPFVDLNLQDEDGLVLASTIITGFGADSERDVEREECVRLLVSEGADINIADKAGWTPLHHAALLAPPTLISHLLTHGSSPLCQTERNMTALDLITAYSVIPGREDVALFLEEAMRGEGWQSSKMATQRRDVLEKSKLEDKQRSEREAVNRILELRADWWDSPDDSPSENAPAEGEVDDEELYTPQSSFSAMLVFNPANLPGIFDCFIHDVRPSVQNADPARALYLLARFACLACDNTWLEDLVLGAVDAIEDTAFNHSEDLAYLIFWLYNCTAWLHLMRCDTQINEACEFLGSFDLIEEIINTVYALLVRVTERRIDKLIDDALLEHAPLSSELETVQFESEWSIFRSPFSSKKKISSTLTPSSTTNSIKSTKPTSPLSPSRPSSPLPPQSVSLAPSTPKASFSSLRQSFNRARGSASISSLQSLLTDGPNEVNSLANLTSFLSAFQMFLTESGINPALITQIWSQVMYWTSCEVFNRILTRKRYLCRSRALQVAMNLGAVEEWIGDAGLPRGVESHFGPVRELLLWLQCLSSMDDFSNLIATIQTMKFLNPLQMRRAVRDYRYEVNEPHMADDCVQYLAQLQKDWERQRVKMGVEALRKEMNGRDSDSDETGSSRSGSRDDAASARSSVTSSKESQSYLSNIDMLFDKGRGTLEWTPQRAPEVLGELMMTTHMLTLQLPSDPRLLAALPGKKTTRSSPNPNRSSLQLVGDADSRSLSRTRSANNTGGIFAWTSCSKQLREVKLDILNKLDGQIVSRRWLYEQHGYEMDGQSSRYDALDSSTDGSDLCDSEDDTLTSRVRLTRLSRTGSRSRTMRGSTG
ncbi:hypothetical protein SCHPADRAFT_872681 [Schizopora paradoxa]|uniref:Dilute domain-containing protein n=1 Tax=Schizopora paradoxa TaxID=27342 RepID=A0A0H2SC55_9AGAM|nr:hypothetical protein SCHPADRAFT_872681 [Schizopora paradoxa]